MTPPLFDYGATATLGSLAAAFAIGIAFGWTLERAGLGQADRLAGQFYLTDFTLFKVLFSAILTAALGAFLLGQLGVLDLSRVYVPQTYILPQIAGGLIFGVGFIAAGLCPGTSCVAAASGRVDGLAVMAGMFAGVSIVGLAFDPLARFYESTARGTLTLPESLGLPTIVVLALLTGLALSAFVLLEWFERRRATPHATGPAAVVGP
jgi:uncharacterized membrane protein YedE/YeeE